MSRPPREHVPEVPVDSSGTIAAKGDVPRNRLNDSMGSTKEHQWETFMISLRRVWSLGVVAAALLSTLLPVQPAGAKRPVQFGINTYVVYSACSNPDATAGLIKTAQTQMAAFRSLGANAVALAFPIYVDSVTSGTVVSGCAASPPAPYIQMTPSPVPLAAVADVAHAAGLAVRLRPLIDETNFNKTPGIWRGVLQPSNRATWFKSYTKVIMPYVTMAQAHGVEHFTLASELDSLASDPAWWRIIAKVKQNYSGDLTNTANWGTPLGQIPKPGTSFGLDAYLGLNPTTTGITDSSTVKQLYRAWLTTEPAGPVPLHDTVIDEVGISSSNGAYSKPWTWRFPESAFNPTIQANWFAMICKVVKTQRMAGMYFWGPWLYLRDGALLTSTNATYGQDIQPATQAVIRRCFGASAS